MIITFLFLLIICMFVFFGIAHVSTYFELKGKYIKKEYLDEFTFISYTKDEILRWLRNR